MCLTSACCWSQSSLQWRLSKQHSDHRLSHTHSNPTAHTVDVSMSGKNSRSGNRCLCTTELYTSNSAIMPRPIQSAFVTIGTSISASQIGCVKSPACSCASLPAFCFKGKSLFCQPSVLPLLKTSPSRRQVATKIIENINICNGQDALTLRMHARCPLARLRGHQSVVRSV